MSIDPIALAQHAAAARKVVAKAQAPAVDFSAMLAGAAPSGEVSAETAAEVLRLRMLSSALSLAGDGEAPAPSGQSLNVQGLLNRFLAQLPSGGAGAGTAEEAGPVVAEEVEGAEGAFQAQQSRFEAGELPEVRVAVPAESGTEAIIEKASRRYGVDSGLIRAVIKAESDFNPRAVSRAGAQGLMQLMPATARGLGVRDSFDPEQNVMAGTRFLKDLLQRYDGNLDEALAAYNWGPARVDKYGTDRLPGETKAYLAKVKAYYSQHVG